MAFLLGLTTVFTYLRTCFKLTNSQRLIWGNVAQIYVIKGSLLHLRVN